VFVAQGFDERQWRSNKGAVRFSRAGTGSGGAMASVLLPHSKLQAASHTAQATPPIHPIRLCVSDS